MHREADDAPVSAGQAHAMGMGAPPIGNLGATNFVPNQLPSMGMGVGVPNVASSVVSSGSGQGHVALTPGGGTVTPTGNHLSPVQPVLSSRSESIASLGGHASPPLNDVGNISNQANVMTNVSSVMAAASSLAPVPGVMAGGDGVGYFAGMWNGYANARPSSSGMQQAYQQQPQVASMPQPLFDWPSAGGSGMPSAVLTTTADGSLAIDAPQAPNALADDFWNDLSASFSAGNLCFNPASRVLFLNSDTPMRQGVSLAEIYARVVESWLVGLPGPTRDYARARILALHDSNSTSAIVRGSC